MHDKSPHFCPRSVLGDALESATSPDGASVRLGQSWEQWDDADSHVEELIALIGDFGLRGQHTTKRSGADQADCHAEAEDEAVS
jgi:hypothetical protein